MEVNEKLVREAKEMLDCIGNKTPAMVGVHQLLREALVPSQPKLYVGQQVIFSGDGNELRGILQGITEDGLFIDEDGTWDECRQDPHATTKPHWIEHDGSETTLKERLVITMDSAENCRMHTHTIPLDRSVIRYCIIPVPKLINSGE